MYVCCVPKIRSTVDTGTLHPPLVLPLIKNVIFHLFGSLMFMLCKRQVNIIQAHQRFDCRGRYFESIHLSLHISIVKVFFRSRVERPPRQHQARYRRWNVQQRKRSNRPANDISPHKQRGIPLQYMNIV